ncbi:MAG: c-type cytochrome [Geminicoccaceae bacterium]
MPKRRLMFVAMTLSLGIGSLTVGQAIWNQSLAQVQSPTPFEPSASFEPPAPVEPDPKKGEKIFRKCKQCHTVQPNEKKVGPSLARIFGRRPGGVEGFGYSQDMIDFGTAGNVWDERTLDIFLTKPRDLMRSTKMAFPGLKKENDRADLIAYLSQF